MKEKLLKILAGESENHILPFFWQHGEDDKTLLDELERIHNSGVGALCIESRPHNGFLTDEWWDDVKLIFDGCRGYGMEAWILDDKYFPTGYCNHAIPDKFPHLGKKKIYERHMDILGPIEDGAVIEETWRDDDPDAELIAVIACRCGEGQDLTGESYDITDRLNGGLVYVDLPEGLWRVFFVYETLEKDGRVDFTNPDSVDVMFSEIYEPHYNHLKEYFGNTFKGFFSDEPFILDHTSLPIRGEHNSHGCYPWNKYIRAEFEKSVGSNWKKELPALWFNMSGVTPRIRVAFMDVVSDLYKTSFCDRVGNWCREHGVMYIGHIVEDHGMHLTFNSGGHFFRSLDGQDMAGIDVVLNQIVPGMTNHPNATPCWYDIADPDFFHYSLAKMGASHSHIQPEKKGRAICEIYGAYGWAEGLKMMKWLTDHMLVRGINNFVPHAFSPKFPDEVPPQFSGAGHNPQEKQFRLIMEYMNRMSTLISDGIHRADAIILYHAESQWSGGQFTEFYTPAKLLTNGHIDFDIVPTDYLLPAKTENGKVYIAKETYPCIIVPMSEYLPELLLKKLISAAENGVDVVFMDKLTVRSCENPGIPFNIKKGGHIHVVATDDLVFWMREHGHYDITTTTPSEYLRFYHYYTDKTHAYMITNEGITDTIKTGLTFDEFKGGDYVLYFPMQNEAFKCHSDTGRLFAKIKPYESVMVFFGDIPDNLPTFNRMQKIDEETLHLHSEMSMYQAENYPDNPDRTIHLDHLVNITGRDMYPRFGGFMKYEMKLDYKSRDGVKPVLDLGKVGETAELFINGRKVGEKLYPPYQFDISDFVNDGENALTVVVTNHLGYEQRDLCSKYMVMEPSGLLGPIKLKYTVPTGKQAGEKY